MLQIKDVFTVTIYGLSKTYLFIYVLEWKSKNVKRSSFLVHHFGNGILNSKFSAQTRSKKILKIFHIFLCQFFQHCKTYYCKNVKRLCCSFCSNFLLNICLMLSNHDMTHMITQPSYNQLSLLHQKQWCAINTPKYYMKIQINWIKKSLTYYHKDRLNNLLFLSPSVLYKMVYLIWLRK